MIFVETIVPIARDRLVTVRDDSLLADAARFLDGRHINLVVVCDTRNTSPIPPAQSWFSIIRRPRTRKAPSKENPIQSFKPPITQTTRPEVRSSLR
jgi:hypothetical protein